MRIPLGEWYDSFDESVDSFKKALSLTLTIFEKEASQTGETLAQIYDVLAHEYQDKERYKEAVEYYEAEIKVLDQLIGIEYQDILGNTLEERRFHAMSHLADVLWRSGRETESIKMIKTMLQEAIDVADHAKLLLTERLVFSVCSTVKLYIENLNSMDVKSMQIDIPLLINSLTKIMCEKKDCWNIMELSNLIEAGLFVINEGFGYNPEGVERFKDRLEFFESVRTCIENIKTCHDSNARKVYNCMLAGWYHGKGKWIFNNGGDISEAFDLLSITLKQLPYRDVLYEELMKELEDIFTEKDSLHTFVENRDVLPQGIPLLHKGELCILEMKHV